MKKTVLIIGLLFAVFIGAFIMQKPFSKEKQRENILRIAIPFDISSFDINSRAHDVNSAPVIKLLFEGLMNKNEQGVPELALADKVDISRYKDKYTFHLRDSKWSDGVPVTAYDFEYSWKRALNPNSKYVTQVPQYFYSIKNAEKCIQGKVPIDDLGVSVVNDTTFIVELEYPDPYFLDLMCCCLSYPIPKHVVSENPKWATQIGMVCNGPFLVENWSLNNQIKLCRNPQYWDKNNISLDGVNILIVPSDFTTLQMFEKGDLDWFGEPFCRMSSDFYRSFEENNSVQQKDSNTIYWIFLNTDKYPFHNKKIREALTYSIDRDSIVDNIFYGFGSPARALLSAPLRVSYTNYFQDDVKISRKLFQEGLEELGITKSDFPVLEFSCVSDLEIHKRVSQSLQDQWRKNLGIEVSIKASEWYSYYSDVGLGNYDMGFMSWRINLPDPKYLFQVFEYKNDIINKSFWENAEFQNTLKQMKGSLGDIERINLISKAESIFMEELPVIPLVFLKQAFVKNPRLKGERFTPFPEIDFKRAYFEDE